MWLVVHAGLGDRATYPSHGKAIWWKRLNKLKRLHHDSVLCSHTHTLTNGTHVHVLGVWFGRKGCSRNRHHSDVWMSIREANKTKVYQKKTARQNLKVKIWEVFKETISCHAICMRSDFLLVNVSVISFTYWNKTSLFQWRSEQPDCFRFLNNTRAISTHACTRSSQQQEGGWRYWVRTVSVLFQQLGAHVAKPDPNQALTSSRFQSFWLAACGRQLCDKTSPTAAQLWTNIATEFPHWLAWRNGRAADPNCCKSATYCRRGYGSSDWAGEEKAGILANYSQPTSVPTMRIVSLTSLLWCKQKCPHFSHCQTVLARHCREDGHVTGSWRWDNLHLLSLSLLAQTRCSPSNSGLFTRVWF